MIVASHSLTSRTASVHASRMLLVALPTLVLASPRPIHAREVAEPLRPLTQRSYQVRTIGSRAYLAATVGLRIIDVSRPGSPRLLGTLPVPGSLNDLAVEDTGSPVPGDDAPAPARPGLRATPQRPSPPPLYAYLAAGPHGVVIADATEPRRPRQLARIDTPGSANGVAVFGNTLYVADGSFGVAIYDVEDRAKPRRLVTVDTRCYARSVSLLGNWVYVSCGAKGLVVFEGYGSGRGRRGWPEPMVRLELPGDVRRVAFGAGRTLYVAAGQAGVHVVDARRPQALKVVATVKVPDFARGVSAWGSLVAVAAGEGGVWLYDCQRRNQPTSLSSYQTKALRSANGVVLRRGQLLVAYDHAGLHVLKLGPKRTLVPEGVFPAPPAPK